MASHAPLQFATFTSEIELPFYSALFASKLDYDKLDDSARGVLGLYEPRFAEPDSSCKMQILGNALTSQDTPLGTARAEGIIKNVNTLDGFKNTDKSAMIRTAGRQIWDAINDGSIYSVPSLLSSFIILSYADLKKYKFTYWFAFPALHSDPQWRRAGAAERFDADESTALVDRVGTWRYSVDSREHGFFLAKKVRGQSTEPEEGEAANRLPYRWEVASLRQFENGFLADVPEEDRYVAFADPSTYAEGPGWPLRNLLVLMRQRFKLSKAKVLCYRDTWARRHEARSVVLPIEVDSTADEGSTAMKEMPKVTGWERSRNGKLQAQQANLGEYMDPSRLADSSVDLNLKLMKWRLAPDLDLELIKNTKCLLLGAGTLGGYVSRNLLGWGVRKVTFVDYGRVSYSNPVRQPLFEFDDCVGGGRPKAEQAARMLKRIYPGVDAEGHSLQVPMLGHAVTDEERTQADFEKLKKLIEAHDVVFLLMDTRESRWLPTVMAKAAGKIVMNAALGFDSYVVMRHGSESSEAGLGCYFCNDVVAPADVGPPSHLSPDFTLPPFFFSTPSSRSEMLTPLQSMKDQTLDQQCTVTRPGVAAMASALLVELLTSLLQHPKGKDAPAPQTSSPQSTPERDPPSHPLGLVPHQIRGYVSTFQQLVIRGQSYDCCSACSPSIIGAYRKGGWDFVKRALREKDYVAELSGLAEVQRRAEEMAGDVDWDEEGLEDGEGELV
ncbi:ubiquitin-like modifier-activating enzyme ATG7 [Geosmithia morbida]|uniref:Ubiquitin-like modifier-activating enzyme ATG7 n=1 Tax=Geosmithia morbida TaxID=1094350 RepID=A0A9P4YYD3_9HYPO|nr:ubiquitin-like modifier-activating enzyme ATG7 [Geosmithia morbida]KAF4124315.1 ubiquitin-like modifier-activating enzyme ATG7 [Geosmithia morbida]